MKSSIRVILDIGGNHSTVGTVYQNCNRFVSQWPGTRNTKVIEPALRDIWFADAVRKTPKSTVARYGNRNLGHPHGNLARTASFNLGHSSTGSVSYIAKWPADYAEKVYNFSATTNWTTMGTTSHWADGAWRDQKGNVFNAIYNNMDYWVDSMLRANL
jgi:hypothetical protein